MMIKVVGGLGELEVTWDSDRADVEERIETAVKRITDRMKCEYLIDILKKQVAQIVRKREVE